jgi:polyisoprenoid-binding protein YceI
MQVRGNVRRKNREMAGKQIIVKLRKAMGYRTALSCTGALLLTAAAGAQDQAPSASIKLDPAKTTVSFTAGTLRHVHGTFALKGGVFAVDSKSGVAQGEILVNADSEKSNDTGLDKKIQGETLESGKYPGIFDGFTAGA